MTFKTTAMVPKFLLAAFSLVTIPLFQNFTSSDSANAPHQVAACDFADHLDTGDKPGDITTVIISQDNAKTTREVTSNGKTLSLKAVELDPRCAYKALELQIRSSNLLLDCKGANFDGRVYKKLIAPAPNRPHPYQDVPGGGFIKSGSIGIRVYNPDENAAPLENVFVRNCNFANYYTGARVQNGYAEKLTNDVARYVNVTGIDKLDFIKDARRIRQEADEIRSHSPHNIEFSHLKIQDSGNDGVEIARFVRGVSISDSMVEGSDGVGVYLNPSSSGNIVKNNTIRNNGYKGYVRSGQPSTGIDGWLREGIAVDSAPGNFISGNTLVGNAGGGIFLYKNCGEYHGWTRPEGSNRNQIIGNIFDNMEVGVWTASRQSMNLKSSQCGDEALLTTDSATYWIDYASDNTVTDNIFTNTATAIRIEDDNTEVARNIFNGNLYTPRFALSIMKRNMQNFSQFQGDKVWGAPVFAGSFYRWKSFPGGGWPVQSPNVHDNSYLAIYSEQTKPQQGVYTEAYGTKHAVVRNNLEGCKSNGHVIASGGHVTDYQEEFVKNLADCRGNERICTNGTLSHYSGDYKFGRCVLK